MARIAILGAAGSLGRHVARQARDAGHEVCAVVRTPRKLPPALREGLSVFQADLAALPRDDLAALLRGRDAIINTAGNARDGAAFVALVARVVAALETLAPAEAPVAWFLAGAGLLDLGETGLRGLDLPVVRQKYKAHAENYRRLQATALDWRLLCPGPMIEGPAVGLERMRITIERVPVDIPAAARWLPRALLLPLFAVRVPEMIIPYADAAAFMLANLGRGDPASRHRVGLALPRGMRGRKDGWATSSQRPFST